MFRGPAFLALTSIFVATAQAFTPPQAPLRHLGLGRDGHKVGVLPYSMAPNSLLGKSGKSKFKGQLGLRKWRPGVDKEKEGGMTLWDQFKAEFSEEGKGTMFEQVHHYFIDLVTVTLGAYMAMLLLTDLIKMRQMGISPL